MRSGSLKEIRPQVWRLRFDGPPDPATGARRQLTATIQAKDARQAQKELDRRIDEALESGTASPRLTVAAQLDRWYARLQVSEGSLRAYAYQVAHLKAAFGAVPLIRLTAAQIEDHYAQERRAGAAPASLEQRHSVLRQMLREARRHKLLTYPLWEDVRAPHAVPVAPRLLTPDDLRTLLRTAGPLRAPLWVFLSTAFRRGEVLALRWDDLDWEKATLECKRSLKVRERAIVEGPPKTPHSLRTVTLPAVALEELRRHEHAQEEERRGDPAWAEGGWMFPRPGGRVWHPETFYGAFQRVLRDAGLPRVRLHSLRHLGLSLLSAGGVSQRVIQARGGHATLAISSRYQHVQPGEDQRAAEVLDTILRELL
jgi:integrase